MRRQSNSMIMKDFHATFTLTVMRRQATPLIMKDIPVTFTPTRHGAILTRQSPP